MNENEFPCTYLQCCHMLSVISHQELIFRILSKHCLRQIRKLSVVNMYILLERIKLKKNFLTAFPRPPPPFICYAPSSILADWSKLPCWVCQFTMVKSYFQRTVLPCQKTYSQHLYEELFYIIIMDSHHSFFDGLEYYLLCASCTRFFCKKNVYEKMSLKNPKSLKVH